MNDSRQGPVDYFDSPMALLDDDVKVRVVMADGDRVPVAQANVNEVSWEPYGVGNERERAIWLTLEDGREFGVVWSWGSVSSVRL